MHSGAVCSVDALQFVLVCYRTLAQAPKFSRSTRTSPQWPVKATEGQVRTTQGTSSTTRGTARAAGRRDAPRTPCFEVHAVDATLHDTSYALRNYTVFGRFRFVVDDREDDDRGFR